MATRADIQETDEFAAQDSRMYHEFAGFRTMNKHLVCVGACGIWIRLERATAHIQGRRRCPRCARNGD